MLDHAELRRLAEGGAARDRAFVDGVLRMQWARDAAARPALAELRAIVIAASERAHAALHARIATGALRGAALRACFDAIAADERDHVVEEVLGIAYPPLEEPAASPELVTYCPSGYEEIVHAFDATALGSGDRFLDIGSGAGKAVLLATLLAGARSFGVERDLPVHTMAVAAARALGIEARTSFLHGDARAAVLAPADVVFMYVPFTGHTLATVMARVLAAPPRFLCAAALELERYPELVAAGAPRSWLHVYACPPVAAMPAVN